MKCLHISAVLHTCCSASIRLKPPCVRSQRAWQEAAAQQSALHLNEASLETHSTGHTSPRSVNCFTAGPQQQPATMWKKKKFIFSQQGVGNKCQRASASQGNVQSSGPSCTYLTVLLGVTVWRLSAVIWTDRWLVWNAAPSDLWNDRDVGAPWERPRLVRPLELHEEL